jgi:TPR repeat protein
VSFWRFLYTDAQVYRDACSKIATMNELGWGVDKNKETAKVWLKKAGL